MKYIIFFFGFSVIVCIGFLFSTKHFMKVFLCTALEGVASFFAVNYIGGFFAIHLPLNLLTAVLFVFGGAPGVIFYLASQTIVAAFA